MEDKMKLGSCDLVVSLRITGNDERIHINSDEGDGFTMHHYKENGIITDEVKQGWKEQLNHIIKYVDSL